MGQRGPLPKLATKATPIQSIEPPSWLGSTAQSYWHQHASWLAKHGLLTKETQDSFALCCDLYERWRDLQQQSTSKTYLDVTKAWQGLVKVFRLSPQEKAGFKPERHDDKEEFDF